MDYSATLTAKCVPRTPMVATEVTNVADPGARRPMTPERYAMVPRRMRAVRPSFPSAGEKRNFSMETRL